MCGLTGYMDLRGARLCDRDVLTRMTQTLVHRGPDADGYFLCDAVGLGFRRLRIIDLNTGDQPITAQNDELALVCNGEIYNYREMRDELIGKGHQFKTQTDVEVLLHLYAEYGQEFLHRLNGQFAFAIYDRRKKQLFMARDHLGISPLHYTVVDDVLIFASEIKAILQHPLVKPQVDLTGLDQLLSFPGTVSPRTMFKDIHSLPAGHALVAGDGQIRTYEYWDLDYPRINEAVPSVPEGERVEQLQEHLREAVRYRLHADVPVGYFLSGGLDSSLLAALAGSQKKGMDSFSISFEDPEVNEAHFQTMMADMLENRHHEARFHASDIADGLRQMVYHCEGPVKETFNTCAMSLSSMARARQVPVILAGQGADELFGGYPGYRVDKSGTRSMGDGLEAAFEDEIREQLWGDPALFYEKNQYAYRETKAAIYSDGLNADFPDFDCTSFDLVNRSRLEGRHILHQRSYLDVKLRMQDHLLNEHGDRMVMMNSTEGRYPFLDINLIDFVRTLPPDLKLNGYEEKYILKRVAEGLVPNEIITREKFGFRAPGSPYLLQQGIEWIHDLLAPERIKRQGYFNPDVVAMLTKRNSVPGFRLNAHLETDLLMVVITFGLFLELFNLPDYT